MSCSTDLIFRALADPTRRGLFKHLCHSGEQTVGALTLAAGVSQPVVSKHLTKLKQAKLVSARQEGRLSIFVAHPEALAPLLDWTEEMTSFWNDRMEALDTLLGQMDQ